ncbi:MAG: hypothetical protein SGCHY_000549 [Lobulomycetales sp.]
MQAIRVVRRLASATPKAATSAAEAAPVQSQSAQSGGAVKKAVGERFLFPFEITTIVPSFLKKDETYRHDPWQARDEWRNHAFFSKWNRLSRVFPGLGMATAAFSVYLVWEDYDNKHGEGAKKTEYWNNWKQEREKRLGSHH